MATRIIILVIGLAITFLAGWLGKLTKSKWDLTKGQQIVRYASAFVAAIGLWIGLSAATYHPEPDASDESAVAEELECVSLEEGRARAAELEVPMVIDFWAEWCTACHELREQVLNHPDTLAVADTFVCVSVDVTQENEENEALREQYGARSLPHVALTDVEGNYLPDASISGFDHDETLGQLLNNIEAAATGASLDGRSEFERTMEDKGLLLAFLLVFLAGLGSSLTPCVYPLIPITIGVFGAAEADTKLQGFLLSVVYVLGIAITYSALGVTAALAGSLFGGLLQNPWVLMGFGVFFIVFALSLLGLYEFQLPGGLQTKLASSGGKGFAGALIMGLVAGIIAAPCVGPILSGVLLFIAETRQVVLGASLMMTFAVGMGVLFMVLGTFSSLIHKLPGSGGWMDTVKAVFGVIFILVALFYASDAVPVLNDIYLVFWNLLG